MITSKRELEFYILADRIMNTGKESISRIRNVFYPNFILQFLFLLRKSEYYSKHNPILFHYYYLRFWRLSRKLGFSIALNVFDYGLVIPHYGTIVVGGGNQIGCYCVLHTSTCITAGSKKNGVGFYLSTGAKVIKNIVVSDGITVASNSVLRSDIMQSDTLVCGVPAVAIKKSDKWWVRDGEKYCVRVQMVENLKERMRIT